MFVGPSRNRFHGLFPQFLIDDIFHRAAVDRARRAVEDEDGALAGAEKDGVGVFVARQWVGGMHIDVARRLRLLVASRHGGIGEEIVDGVGRHAERVGEGERVAGDALLDGFQQQFSDGAGVLFAILMLIGQGAELSRHRVVGLPIGTLEHGDGDRGAVADRVILDAGSLHVPTSVIFLKQSRLCRASSPRRRHNQQNKHQSFHSTFHIGDHLKFLVISFSPQV